MERIKVKPRRKPSKFFFGNEVENTHLRLLPTLFVVGEATLEEVCNKLQEIKDCSHVFLGARDSATEENVRSLMNLAKEIMEKWDLMWVTLDFDFSLLRIVRAHEAFRFWKFVPLIHLKIPDVLQLPSLTSFKIDDRFMGKNGGVWTLQLRDLLRVEHAFTPWKAYENDKEV